MLQPNARTTKILKKSCFIAALFVSICIVFPACRNHTPAQEPDLCDSTLWREGDLVLRCGWGMESRAVTTNSQSAYSHTGILHYDSRTSNWQVVHAVPGEDKPEYVKAEPVALFFSHERARSGAWLRVDCSDSIARQAAAYAIEKVEQKVEFDNNYLLSDTTMLYCTELIWLSYCKAGIDISGGARQSVPTLFCKEGECIFPANIEQSKSTLFIKSLKTKSL